MPNTKDRIIETAFKLFLTRGYSVGINEIINKSDTSKGTFYHYFKSKEKLFVEIIDKFFFGSAEYESIACAKDKSFKDKLLSIVKFSYKPFNAISESIPETDGLNYLSIMAEYPKHSILKEKRLEKFKESTNFLEKIIKEAQQNGSIRRTIDAHILSIHFFTLIDGTILDAIMMFNSVKEAEKACIKAVEQFTDILAV
ncbi:MAG: TetR/AcrR family transcriptional regulator [Bacteroidales bacterium]|jgi:AcrR family transcriptional regulator|nr:TetR/AcrR family transcriptional regulator [Bacteroidales bacterium]